jgi:hypothetical protein
MAINVGNASAAKLIAASTEDQLVNVKNTGTNPIVLGKTSAVTAATGAYSLAGGASIQVSLNAGEELYGICAAAQTSTVDAI